MKDKNFSMFSVSELLDELDRLFYRSAESHKWRMERSNQIMVELKFRFAETGI